jgi:hypothetical protein
VACAGTGKSWFAWYWLWLLSKTESGRTIIYEFDNMYYSFKRGDAVMRGDVRSQIFRLLIDDPVCATPMYVRMLSPKTC